MAKIEIIVKYDSREESNEILNICKKYEEVESDRETTMIKIQKILQKCFDDGRNFQKNNATIK